MNDEYDRFNSEDNDLGLGALIWLLVGLAMFAGSLIASMAYLFKAV